MTDFGGLGGVKITGFISPTDTNDTYAVIDPLYGIDGLRNLTGGTSDLNAIPDLRRRSGMIVGISGGTEYYKLLPEGTGWTHTIADWQAINFDGASALSALTDTNINSVANGDTLVYSGGSWINIERKVTNFSASANSQTIFPSVLISAPLEPEKSMFYVNGVKQRYGASYDFHITGGTTLVWSSNKHNLETDDDLEISYV